MIYFKKFLIGCWLVGLSLAWSGSAFAYSKTDCLALVKVKSWKGTYTIKGSNVGTGSGSGFGYQWDYQSNWTAEITVDNFMAKNGPIVCEAAFKAGAIPYFLEWGGSGAVAASTGTMTGKETVTNTCSSGKTSTDEYQPTSTQTAEISTPFTVLLSLSNGTYSVGYGTDGIDPGRLPVIVTESSCMPGGTVSSYNQTEGLAPQATTALTGTLPGVGSASMALKGSRAYNAIGPFGIHSQVSQNPATWIETWDLQPVYTDTPPEAKKEVEDPCLAAGSIIGCENRSLGEVMPLSGTPYRLHYQSNRASGTTGANTVAVAYAADLGGWTLSAQHRYDPATNTLFLGTGAFRSSASLGTVTPSATSGFLIASEDGQLVYQFNTDGLHTQTLNALTGTAVLNFAYDATGEWLTSVTDGSGNVTTFNRNVNGKLTAITGPYGQISKVTLNKQGFIAALQDPAGKFIKAKYSADGLLSAYSDARGMISSFSYDAHGLLLKDKDAAGGIQSLSINSAADTVTRITAEGRSTLYKTTVQTDGSIDRKVTEPTGLIRTMKKSAQLASTVIASSGVQMAMTPANDMRFGSSASFPQAYTVTTPGGISKSIASSRVSTLSNSTDPLSLATQTETLQLNSKTFTSSFDAASKTLTEASPSGRSSVSTVDSLDRITNEVISGIAPIDYSYDSHGHLVEVATGSGVDQRTAQRAFNMQGYLETIIDPLGQSQSFSRDKLGQVVQQTLPDGNTVKFTYDAGGYLQKLTNPAGNPYGFSYSKTGLLSAVTLPRAKGAKTKKAYAYNRDGQLTGVTRLDGTKLAYSYDTAGRLSALTSSANTWVYGYDDTYGYLSTITEPGGISLGFTRDGPLLQALTWSGTLTGQVGFTYNNDFQVQTVSVNSANPITYSYDTDGLLSKAGDLAIQRSSQNALRTGSSLGSVQDSYTYNGFGEVTRYQANVNGTTLMSVDYVYDKLGRIVQLTESLEGGAARVIAYSYDPSGRLVSVTDGAVTTTYSYDKNGNRLTFNPTGGTSVTGSYDAQDRLLSYGAIKYEYTANGEVSSRTQSNLTTLLSYNLRGNLVGAVLPPAGGTRIDYLVDGSGMRIGKKVNGVLKQAFLYQDKLKPVAELDVSGNIVSRFVYATRVNVPDYMIKGGVTYRIITDRLGSPRLVVNVADGAVAQRLDYDEFGNVLQDTQPGFQPFGFAGGLYDTDTGLIHYGAREFDTKVGRWMSRDPILFSGAGYNAYANLNDPVNTVDPSGREGFWSGIKTAASNFIHDKFSSVKVGPVSISTDAPKVSIGASQEIAAGDVSLIEISAEASVEVITTGGAADDLLKGNVSIGAKQSFLAKLPFIGGCFSKKIEAEATVKINPELVERMNTNINRAWQVSEN